MAYNPLIEQLYGSIGKTPDLIDAEGAAYWENAFASGAKSPADFLASANYVYSQPSSYTESPYAEQNTAGLQNRLTTSQAQQQPKPVAQNQIPGVTQAMRDYIGLAPGLGSAGGGQGQMPMLPGGGVGGGGGQNPYLGQMSDDITRRTGIARDQALQGIRGNAIGVGGLGGSRQGVAEAGVINQSLDNLTGQLANLNFQDYTGQQNRNLQQYGMDQGFYTSQRGQDLAQIGLGSQLETQALQNQWYPITQAANIYGNLGGLNSSTTNTASQGGGAMGALGGLLGTAQIGSNLKWW